VTPDGAAARAAERLRRLLPALWLGGLLTLAAMATPAAVALLQRVDAGRVAGRLLAQEAQLSLALGLAMLLLERFAARRRVRSMVAGASRFSTGMALAVGALFCTVAGYYALLPLMEAARAGQGRWTFGQLHAASALFFGVKALLVAALAWRAVGEGGGPPGGLSRPTSPCA
jgi:hypothetical protein